MARPPPSSPASPASSPAVPLPLTAESCRPTSCTRACRLLTTMPVRRRRPRPLVTRLGRPSLSPLLVLVVVLGMLADTARAVLISSFSSCLSENTKQSTSAIQFWPLLAAASFTPKTNGSDMHVLDLTVWGMVTGADPANPGGTKRRDLSGMSGDGFRERRDVGYGLESMWNPAIGVRERSSVERRALNGTDLVVPGQAPPTYWNSIDAARLFPDLGHFGTTGQIVDEDPGWGQNIATTLLTTITVANINLLSVSKYLCHTSNGTVVHSDSVGVECPIVAHNITGADRNDVQLLIGTNGLQNITISHELDSRYSFSTLEVTMIMLAGDKKGTRVGCINLGITPTLTSGYHGLITWVVATVLIVVGIATIAGAMFNPWTGTTDVFRWSCNWGSDEDVIRLVTPGFADCLNWFQFGVLSAGLSLNYPGFYQPVVATAAWSALLVDTSFYSHDPMSTDMWRADGVYAVESWRNGYQRLAQYVGLATVNDTWTCVVCWYAIILTGAVVISQLWLWGKWAVKKVTGVETIDLRNMSWPFTTGLILRITFTWFFVPLLSASFFLVTVVSQSTATIVALAAVCIIGFLLWAAAAVYFAWIIKPRQRLFDNQTTLLTYGTFYNTFREKSVNYFPIPVGVNVLRGIAFGALQPSGIAQITILAVSEVVVILSLWGTKPYPYHASMNIYQVILAFIRLLIIMVMMTFVPSIGASDTTRAYAGWVLLGLHALTIIFAFFLRSAQTLLEILIRSMRRDVNDAERGGLAQVFGLRQLTARKRSETARSSSATTMTIPGSDRKHTLTPGSRRPHSRSGSSAILLGSPISDGPILPRDGSQHAHSNSGSYTPTPPMSYGYGFPAGPMTAGGLTLDTAAASTGPYYRAPRPRRGHQPAGSDGYSPAAQSRGSWGSDLLNRGRSSQGSLGLSQLANQLDDWDEAAGAPRSASQAGGPAPSVVGEGTDYAVREVDFYYGVRGPALSEQPTRRLGTGPADPTGPVSTAKSWFRKKLGLVKSKEEQGFSVVRSSRAPQALLDARREAGIADEPAEGAASSDSDAESDGENNDGAADRGGSSIGVAVTSPERVIPNRSAVSPSSSDSDEEDAPNILMLPEAHGSRDSIEMEGRISRKPTVPRKSSKRKSRELVTAVSENLSMAMGEPSSPTEHTLLMMGDPGTLEQRMPFERHHSHTAIEDSHSRSISTTSSVLQPPAEITDEALARPASVGEVHRHRVGDALHHLNTDEHGHASIRGSQAELVRGGSGGSRKSGKSRLSRDSKVL